MKNRHVLEAFYNALNGIRVLISEHSARRELALLIATLFLLILSVNIYTLVLFVLAILLLALESLNTAIEELCNFLTTERDPRIKRIKDLGAAAILFIATAFAIVLALYGFQFFK